ncbi:hypothetical protein COOONC_27019 [Cooperia oncophora]
MIIFIILAAVLLLAILGTLAWLLMKRRTETKKAGFAERFIHQQRCQKAPQHCNHNDMVEVDAICVHRGYPPRRDGYGNNMYHGDSGYGPGSGGLNIDRGGGSVTRDIAIRDARRDFARPPGDRSRDLGGSRVTVSSDGNGIYWYAIGHAREVERLSTRKLPMKDLHLLILEKCCDKLFFNQHKITQRLPCSEFRLVREKACQQIRTYRANPSWGSGRVCTPRPLAERWLASLFLIG